MNLGWTYSSSRCPRPAATPAPKATLVAPPYPRRKTLPLFAPHSGPNSTLYSIPSTKTKSASNCSSPSTSHATSNTRSTRLTHRTFKTALWAPRFSAKSWLPWKRASLNAERNRHFYSRCWRMNFRGCWRWSRIPPAGCGRLRCFWMGNAFMHSVALLLHSSRFLCRGLFVSHFFWFDVISKKVIFDWLIDWLIDCSIDWSFDWLIDCSIVRLIDWLRLDWCFYWLTELRDQRIVLFPSILVFRSLSRLLDPVNAVFSTDSTGNLPTPDELAGIVKSITTELVVCGADDALAAMICGNIARQLRLIFVKLESAIASDGEATQVIGGLTAKQAKNFKIIDVAYRVKFGVEKVLKGDKNNTIPESARKSIEDILTGKDGTLLVI